MVLEHKLHELESEKLDLQSQASECTRPLLKQLESLMVASEQQQLEAQDALEKVQEDLSNSTANAAALQVTKIMVCVFLYLFPPSTAL